MMQMPMGQYRPGNTFFHRADAKGKLLGLCLVIAAVRPVRELPCEAVRLVVQLGSMLARGADKLNPQFVQGGPY